MKLREKRNKKRFKEDRSGHNMPEVVTQPKKGVGRSVCQSILMCVSKRHIHAHPAEFLMLVV